MIGNMYFPCKLTPISLRIFTTSLIWSLTQTTGFMPNRNTVFFRANTKYEKKGINTESSKQINTLISVDMCLKRKWKTFGMSISDKIK